MGGCLGAARGSCGGLCAVVGNGERECSCFPPAICILLTGEDGNDMQIAPSGDSAAPNTLQAQHIQTAAAPKPPNAHPLAVPKSRARPRQPHFRQSGRAALGLVAGQPFLVAGGRRCGCGVRLRVIKEIGVLIKEFNFLPT